MPSRRIFFLAIQLLSSILQEVVARSCIFFFHTTSKIGIIVMSSEQGTVLLIVTWVLCAVTIGVVGMRLYADAFILHKIRVDSYIILITFVRLSQPPNLHWRALLTYNLQLFVITQQIFTTLMVHSGMGQHVKSLTPAQIELSLKYSWIAQPMQLFANSLGKLAVVAYLTTIHGPSNARLKLSFIWSVGASQFVSVVICITLIFLQCTPLPKLWDETIEGTCDGRLRNQNFAYFQGGKLFVTHLEPPLKRDKPCLLSPILSSPYTRCSSFGASA